MTRLEGVIPMTLYIGIAIAAWLATPSPRPIPANTNIGTIRRAGALKDDCLICSCS